MQTVRLDKALSTLLCISRSDAKRMIRKKQVSLNGVVINALDARVIPSQTEISANGSVFYYENYTYIIMNKPAGYCCTNDNDGSSVLTLLPPELKRSDLVTVGRLDKDTTGLLLITNDGDFVHSIISPKKQLCKYYRTTVSEPMSENAVKQLQNGITLSDGTICSPAIVRQGENECEYIIGIFEGKYHQVRRMVAAVDNCVIALERIGIGTLAMNNLSIGQARKLSESEKALLFVQ